MDLSRHYLKPSLNHLFKTQLDYFITCMNYSELDNCQVSQLPILYCSTLLDALHTRGINNLFPRLCTLLTPVILH